MQKSQYRPDIDGLRAIAVISVLLFHAGFTLFPGGYVGVDVFFVISGYLITKLIRDEVIATKEFSFSRFYIRRVRRLFPAFFVTLAVSAVFAVLLMSPQYLQKFGESLLYAIVSISNFFFWQESGYFDTANEMKPLLHTWSLSVEEQFYLIWPIALVFLLKKNWWVLAPLALLVAGVLSLLLNLFAADIKAADSMFGITKWVPSSSSAMFYLLPFRVFEFAIGGLLVWVSHFQPKRKMVLEPLLLIGLAMIGCSIFFFTEDTLFPSYNALLPCIGAALVIYAGRAKIVGFFLANKVSVSIGLISYSLYLVHWPLIVFWSYWKMEPLSITDGLLIIALSFVLATIMYHYVEKPFRHPSSRLFRKGRVAALSVGFFSLAATLPASSMAYFHSGWEWRIGEARQALQLDPKTYHRTQYGGAGIANHSVVPLGEKDLSPQFLITGDSHARQYSNAIDQLLIEHGIGAIGLFDGGCMVLPDATRYKKGEVDEQCADNYSTVTSILDENAKIDLFLVHQWKGYIGYNMKIGHRDGSGVFEFSDRSAYDQYVIEQAEKLILDNGDSRNYHLIGVAEAFGGGQRQSLVDCLYRPAVFSKSCTFKSPRTEPSINQALEELANKYENVYYIEPRDALCGESFCQNVLDGLPVHSDGGHLSKRGSERVVNHFSQLFIDRFDR